MDVFTQNSRTLKLPEHLETSVFPVETSQSNTFLILCCWTEDVRRLIYFYCNLLHQVFFLSKTHQMIC